ncbi:MAG: hypothetical protein HY787_02540 [Deltaproteobacteria bacterium]|nr:hypothetical protein [Deltaproteobacteria bacterium]
MKRMIFSLTIFSFLSVFMVQGLYAKDKDPLAGESLFKDVVHYSYLGDHRTATVTDKVTAIWIRNRLKKAGYAIQMQEWTTRQFYPLRTEIIIDKTRGIDAFSGSRNRPHPDNPLKIEAFPVWWPKPTTPRGIEALLTDDLNNANGKIYLLINVTPATFSVTPALTAMINTAYNNGAVAVVVVTYFNGTTSIASDEFIGLNATQATQDEWPIPVVSAMARDRQALDTAILNQSQVRVVSTGIYDDQAKALNVIGTLDRGPGSKVLVVSTPYSGWFTCAGERGAGVAFFLGLAEWAAHNTKDTTWIFTATSGHEIGGLGINHYLESAIAPGPENTSAWAHLGAWQAMYEYVLEDGVLVPTDHMDFRLFQYKGDASLGNAVIANFQKPEVGPWAGFYSRIFYGDLTAVSNPPYNYTNVFGISYAHEFHHSTQDLLNVTGPELLEPVARAYQETLEMLIP